MANRTMAAKAMKLKRQRRAWAKPYGYSGMQRPNVMVLASYKERAKGLAVDEKSADAIAAFFYNSERGPKDHNRVHPGKYEVLSRIEQIAELEAEIELKFGCTLRFKGPGPDNSYQRSFVYFNPTKTCYVVVHEDFREHVIRRSLPYSCKEIVMAKWPCRITWQSKESLPKR